MAGSSLTDGADGPTRRVLSVLEAFAPDGGPCGVSELARRARLSKSTTHRLLQSLLSAALVERHDQKYQLGAHLAELGRLVPDPAVPKVPDPRLNGWLRRLGSATGETARLSVDAGGHGVYVSELLGGAPGSVSHRRVYAPFHSTASGKALLAFSSADRLPGSMRAIFERYTSATVVSPVRLARELAVVRAQRVAFERHEFLTGECAVASPVLESHGQAVAAFSVEGVMSEERLRRAAVAVREFAARAGADLAVGAG
ncbi:IclR family transcriptional regulator [Streptomyces sp. NPDC056632]|uniref:IclR family transcriptional regulator n=1 Tax=Streptomyces sp. NPDC056632 TaxID=3345884 RepID=UPI0036AB63E0